MYSEAEINKIVGNGESHLIIESIWNSCGKSLRLLVKRARWKEVTSATTMTTTSTDHDDISSHLSLAYYLPNNFRHIKFKPHNHPET